MLACGTNTYQGITNYISDFRCQHLQRQYEIPYRNINFSHLILRSSSFMFPVLLIIVEINNTICNSLITMFVTSWRNLIKIGWSELYKILSLFYKKPFHMLSILTYRYRHFERCFCNWNNFMMLKYLIQYFHLSLFQKLR